MPCVAAVAAGTVGVLRLRHPIRFANGMAPLRMTDYGKCLGRRYIERKQDASKKTVQTTIDIDDALMRKAMRLSGLTTKRAVVEAALRLLI